VKCPFCGHDDTQVKDSRPSEDGGTIRRRRFCPACDSRFTTFERVQLRELTVIKRSGDRKPFDRDKIVRSMAIALRKRPVEAEHVERAINRIVQTLESEGENDIACETIGNLVMDALRGLDQVAYIRYASVYRDFREAGDFGRFMEDMRGDEAEQIGRTGARHHNVKLL
jgi:transcriptional repressor NrdR